MTPGCLRTSTWLVVGKSSSVGRVGNWDIDIGRLPAAAVAAAVVILLKLPLVAARH